MNEIKKELTFGNDCTYKINENRVVISIDRICNNRDINNLSGSLSIEVLACSKVFDGSDYSNSHYIASTSIGEIQGQHFLENCNYDLILNELPVGTWNLTLMLKEFNGQDYDLIDYVNFEMPYSVFEETKIVETKEEVKAVVKTQNEVVEEVKVEKIPENKTLLSKIFKKIFG